MKRRLSGEKESAAAVETRSTCRHETEEDLMETVPEKVVTDTSDMPDSGLGLMLFVLLVLTIVAALAT